MLGFKPFGFFCEIEGRVQLQIDEFESIRLVNYQMLTQEEAANEMKVSRPTFTRIYNGALKKLAQVIVDCKVLEIEGGEYEYNQQWYRCKKCYKIIQGIHNHKKCNNCEDYGENELINLNTKK
jgi:predicted DNA-binding protein (UPF0251 family)